MVPLEERGVLELANEAPGDDFSAAHGPAPQPVGQDEQIFDDETWEEEELPRRDMAWILPALAMLAVLGWTGFYVWANQGEILSPATPQQWIEWIVAWAVPVLLVIGLWQLAMRHSRREAARFADAASALSRESALLEKRLLVVNRELSLARDFIASQSRDLESLGRLATERLSQNAERLQDLITNNGDRLDTIGSVSNTALSNMERLRDQLPVLANAARDMSNQIGNAGNVAQRQIEDLVDGFDRLNQFGEAGQKHVDTVGGKVNETLQGFERIVAEMSASSQKRFATLREQSEQLRAAISINEGEAMALLRQRGEELEQVLGEHALALRASEADASAAMRERLDVLRRENETLVAAICAAQDDAGQRWSAGIDALEKRMREAIAEVANVDEAALNSARKRLIALTDEAKHVDAGIAESAAAFDQGLARRRDEAARSEEEALAAVRARLAGFDAEIAERQQLHLASSSAFADKADAIATRLAELDGEIARLAGQSDDARNELAEASEVFVERLSQSRSILEENGAFVSRLTDDSVRMLEIIRAASDHSQEDLSRSIERAEARLGQFVTKAEELQVLIASTEQQGANVAAHVAKAREDGEASAASLDDLDKQLRELSSQSDELARHTREELQGALDLLAASSGKMLDDMRCGHADAIREIADSIAASSNDAIAAALRSQSAATITELEESAGKAAARGRETTIMLRDQLAKVNALVGNLERRVSQAREKAEEKVDTDFTRRMALITEALHSSAIDISKAFDNEVSDTQWAHYLKGDRGIFTRRAVRMLDKNESRQVAGIYREDSEFRATVNRYIHDFEAMLRSVLSTRDGNAIAVTLLSSDIGKLYVALAQSIDRLRD